MTPCSSNLKCCHMQYTCLGCMPSTLPRNMQPPVPLTSQYKQAAASEIVDHCLIICDEIFERLLYQTFTSRSSTDCTTVALIACCFRDACWLFSCMLCNLGMGLTQQVLGQARMRGTYLVLVCYSRKTTSSAPSHCSLDHTARSRDTGTAKGPKGE